MKDPWRLRDSMEYIDVNSLAVAVVNNKVPPETYVEPGEL